MHARSEKPILVPTAVSAKVALWSLVYAAAFGALLWVYRTHGAIEAARAELSRPVVTNVENSRFAVDLPPGWSEYAKDDNSVTAFRDKGENPPILRIVAVHDERFAFHALDVNPVVVLKLVLDDMASDEIKGVSSNAVLKATGSEVLTVKPGVNAVRLIFDMDELKGETVVFYQGSVRYLIWAVWHHGDDAASSQIDSFCKRLFDDFDIPDLRESIDRPVVHSGQLTSEINEKIHGQVSREMAMWNLFAARAKTEPDVALLPALRHYREALRLLSSIRQERAALATADFARYCALLEARRRDVAEWFVVLDKAVAMRDWEKARRQAQWIMKHATLTGERLDARRAEETLAKVEAEIAKTEAN